MLLLAKLSVSAMARILGRLQATGWNCKLVAVITSLNRVEAVSLGLEYCTMSKRN